MEKNLIVKATQNKQKENSLIMNTGEEKWELNYPQYFDDIMLSIFGSMQIEQEELKKLQDNVSFNNLYALIKKGFSIRLDEIENGYQLIVRKGNSAISFTATKRQGVSKVLIEAEEWAETMLEELEKGNNI